MNAGAARNAATALEQRFHDFIAAPDYPCVGAKTALTRGHLSFVAAGDIRSPDFDMPIVDALQRFALDADKLPMFVSTVVLFGHTPPLPEREFEDALWQRLQAIHELDAQGFAWDAAVSPDPASPEFAFSVGGHGFFVIGLHPGASRKARRFERPALVFNPHSQFAQLRAEGRFGRVSRIIAKRDRAFCGSVNPMLARHGEGSDAPQYSGREVGAGWRCPFRAQRPGASHGP